MLYYISSRLLCFKFFIRRLTISKSQAKTKYKFQFPVSYLNKGCIVGVILVQYFFIAAVFWMSSSAWALYGKVGQLNFKMLLLSQLDRSLSLFHFIPPLGSERESADMSGVLASATIDAIVT